MATRRWLTPIVGLAIGLSVLVLATSVGEPGQAPAGQVLAQAPTPTPSAAAELPTPQPTATPWRPVPQPTAAATPPIPARQPPRFSGVTIHMDPLDRFWIRYPSDWDFQVQADVGEGGQDGVSFRPNPEDSRTLFSLWVKRLERRAVAEDLEELRAGARQELDRLPGIDVETFSEIVLDDVIRFELVYSFREDEATLKRKAWVIYGGNSQYTVTWQGSSPEEYEYWLAMANYSFATMQLPPSLWAEPDFGRVAS